MLHHMVAFKVLDPEAVPSGYSQRVLDYWNETRGGVFAPAWGHTFKLEDLGWDILPSMSVVDVLDDGQDFIYRYWGGRNVEHKGYEMSGKKLSDYPLGVAYRNGVAQFGEVLDQRRALAIIYEGEYLTSVRTDQITYRFPLSSNGSDIDKIVTYQNLEVKPENWQGLFEDFRALNGMPPDDG